MQYLKRHFIRIDYLKRLKTKNAISTPLINEIISDKKLQKTNNAQVTNEIIHSAQVTNARIKHNQQNIIFFYPEIRSVS